MTKLSILLPTGFAILCHLTNLFSIKAIAGISNSSNPVGNAQIAEIKGIAPKAIVSPLQQAAQSQSFAIGRDGGSDGDTGNNFATARPVSLNQMYSGYLNASRGDDRDCYTYKDLPPNSKLQVAAANHQGILGISAYSANGQILIGQMYMVNQPNTLITEIASGQVMVCLDNDGEKSNHQYTFEARFNQ
jgi:hypothetical protein